MGNLFSLETFLTHRGERNAAFAWLELYRAMLNYHRNRNSYNCMDVLFEPCESSDPPTLRYDLTSRRVTVGLTMIQRPVKWCLNLFPLFLFLSSPLLLLAVILSSILTSLFTDPLSLSLSLSASFGTFVCRIFSLSLSL